MAKTDETQVGVLAHSPTHLLHTALQLALDIYSAEVGVGGLTQRQYAVLAAAAAHEGLTQTELVEATGIDRSTLAAMIARMIEKGLLARERSSRDARAKTVQPTELGRAALESTAPLVAQADARILGHLAAGKRDAFITALFALSRAGEASLIDEGDGGPKKKKKKNKSPKPPKSGKAERKKKKKAKRARAAAETPPETA